MGWGSVAGRSKDACVVARSSPLACFGICNNTLAAVARCRCFAGAGAATELEARARQGTASERAQGIMRLIFTQIITTTSRFGTLAVVVALSSRASERFLCIHVTCYKSDGIPSRRTVFLLASYVSQWKGSGAGKPSPGQEKTVGIQILNRTRQVIFHLVADIKDSGMPMAASNGW